MIIHFYIFNIHIWVAYENQRVYSSLLLLIKNSKSFSFKNNTTSYIFDGFQSFKLKTRN